MEDLFYRRKWEALKTREPDSRMLARLSDQIAHSFLDKYLKDHSVEERYIDLLCEMSTSPEAQELNSQAARSLFGIIIESLCDEFEELQTMTYNQVMTRVIAYCRGIPAGRSLDDELKRFQLFSRQDLLERIIALRQKESGLENPRRVQTAIILSRVTLGADVAITSVVIQRLQKALPGVRIVVVGAEKLQQVYGGNRNLSLKQVDYARRGGLLQRLDPWHQVLECIREETRTVSPGGLVLFDPDSRLSQLGVLPVCPFPDSFFFDSRSERNWSSHRSMAETANAWLDRIVGEQGLCFPRVWVPEAAAVKARHLAETIRAHGAARLVVLNFGVGGNARKRVGPEFETRLMHRLLQEPKTVLLLDTGAGSQELESGRIVLQRLKDLGHPVREQGFASDAHPVQERGVLGIRAAFGEMSALIACADEFIGYDSAFQHIAAAQGTPCLTIFAGSNNMRFIRRWSAFGPNSSRIIHVDTLNHPRGVDVEDIVVRVMHQRALAGLLA
mgnify:CR=1 FL=1